MEQAVGLLARTLKRHELVTDEGRAVLEVVEQYARSWRLLLEYDERRLAEAPLRPRKPSGHAGPRERTPRHREPAGAPWPATECARVSSARSAAISWAPSSATSSRRSAARLSIPSVQARAAHLLYFLIKDHPFADGNKRIGTLLFLEYLRRNGMLVRADGTFRLADNTMVALALLVAESEPKQKDLMIRLVLSLLEDGK